MIEHIKGMTPNPLAILIVEDAESDVQLLVRLLKKAGYQVVFEQAETAEQMRSALEKQAWDIIISDYSMPQFDGRAALTILKETGLDIPFIVVSGTMGEDIAVAMMKAGAQDYLRKGDFARLIPAVERELEQAMLRRKHKKADDDLRESDARYRELFTSMVDGFALHEIICDKDGNPIDYRFLEVNPYYERLTGLRAVDLIGRTALEISPNNEPNWIDVYGSVALTGRSAYFENYDSATDRHFEISVYCPKAEQFAVIMVDISERKQAEERTHQRVTELEMLYQSGLALSQLLNPKEIEQKILEMLKEKLGWQNARMLFFHSHDNKLELLKIRQADPMDKLEHVQTLTTRLMNNWAIQQGQPVRMGDVSVDPRYIGTYPGVRSGLYIPMKLDEDIVGVISIEDERPDVFSEADEHLIATLANQARSALINARLFEETRQRVSELETLDRISQALRVSSNPKEMLGIVLDEALALLNTTHGSIELYNKTTDSLDKIIARGWMAQVTEPQLKASEGIAGKVFVSGESHTSHEFASDPELRDASRSLTPVNWGGVCLPIRTTEKTLGVMIISVPSERKLDQNELRLLATLSEITGTALQRMQLHEQTAERLEHLQSMRIVDQAIANSYDLRLTLNILLAQTISQLGVDAADVLLLKPGSNLLELVAGRGFHTLLLESVNLSNSFTGLAFKEQRSIMSVKFEDIALHENLQLGRFWKEEGFACFWCVPLTVNGEIKGVLEVYRRTAFTPDAEWLEFLESLAGQAAITIDKTQLFENLERSNLDLSLAYDTTIEGWSRAMDLRDHETEGHTQRVTDLTLELARALRVEESQLAVIRRGALLHDMGKMGIPDSILLKKGKLTDDEWVLMRKHPKHAFDMLSPITYLSDALDIPYCHHEKWDGTGYPQGLKGDRIPLPARIFAIVDVWDALTSDRVYRKKWTKQKALGYINEQNGRHFDPQVVDAFMNITRFDPSHASRLDD